MWLIWFIIGAALAILEFAVPGLIIIFIGLACWAVALLLWLGVKLTVGWQLFLCAFFSVFFIVFLRKRIKWLKGREEALPEDEYIGKTAIVVEKIIPEQGGKIKLEGTYWPAKSNEIIEENEVVKIVSKESILMMVERLNKKEG
ncbi:MAG TPA: NfeD family protein [bacterium]|nr:NfeD family protein [bacterium]HOL47139.1 NfeD family protein [bacterium]HPQ17928.1 NfeD family protein [bacterium]